MHGNMRLNAAGIEGATRVFRVEGRVIWPVVTEEVKTALEDEDVTGLRYSLVSSVSLRDRLTLG